MCVECRHNHENEKNTLKVTYSNGENQPIADHTLITPIYR